MRDVAGQGITVEHLEALWGSEPYWRVVPVFYTEGEESEAQALLCRLLHDSSPHFTSDCQPEGAARLRRMALTDARCSDFAAVADLLEADASGCRLMLGWSMR